MASQSLYRKWRSQTFSDLIGQEAVVRTLLNAVREGRLAHAYLFSGPRGTGKTSTARLLAKAINCAHPVNGEPCNECISCREITAGHSPDVIEIDAASNTGVDNIRDLRQNASLISTSAGYRVYIIDEVHMLSNQAFNALLKTLEEPPPHIIFVLATTEEHKVLATVVSRCQRFVFRRHTVRNIVARLQYVASGEGLDLEPAAAELLARAAQGGMRDALSLLDQAVAYCGTHIDLERTRLMLGLADPGLLKRLIECVADQRAGDGLYLINDIVTSGADIRQINAQFADEWRALLLARAGADVATILDRTDEEVTLLTALANRFSLEELTACARVFTRGDSPARGLPVPQLGLELSFLECVNIKANGGAVSAQPAMSASQATQPAPAAPAPVRPSARPPEVAAAPARPPEPDVEDLDLDSIEREPVDRPAGRTRPAMKPPAAPSVAPPPAETPPARPPQPIGVPAAAADIWTAVVEKWTLVKQVCKQKSRSVAALLHSAHPVGIDPGDVPVVVLQADHKFHYEGLREPPKRASVEWAFEQVLEYPVHVRIIAPDAIWRPNDGGASTAGGNGSVSPRSGPGQSSGGGNVRPFPNQPGGQQSRPVPPDAEGSTTGGAMPANITPLRQPAAAERVMPSLEDDARADAVVQTFLRTGATLVDVRPLTDDDAEY